ncbi:hypothetical protein ACH5RR_002204 [Cinchona calisaya]|uniref:Uncharacterized protein n=1 Tax=Cinchona calisaya TaxID=153742 RepID=A0ABD3B5L8_9GENT
MGELDSLNGPTTAPSTPVSHFFSIRLFLGAIKESGPSPGAGHGSPPPRKFNMSGNSRVLLMIFITNLLVLNFLSTEMESRPLEYRKLTTLSSLSASESSFGGVFLGAIKRSSPSPGVGHDNPPPHKVANTKFVVN